MNATPTRPPGPAQPAAVGRYRLLRRVGEGGMGVVYLADGGDGQVAVKVLRPHVVGDDEGRARLEREVASLRRVSSPRVAEVLDADPWGETPFVVTRYVAGPSLAEDVRDNGPIPADALPGFAARLAEAVAAVHAVGVVHRDVKPSNVLLEDGLPVLIDFGLARVAEDARLTMSGWLLGTPGYLAPEILYGDDATGAADMHSWAATVVYAATGRPPYGTGPAVAVMDRVRRGEYQLDGVPADLEPLLRECLDLEPLARPTAREVCEWFADHRWPGEGAALRAGHAWDDESPWDTRVLRSPAPAEQPPPASAGVRLLRSVGTLVCLLGLAAAFALAPWVAAGVFTVGCWALTCVSRSTEAMAARRAARGRRRGDRFRGVVTTPWHLALSLPGTVLLVVCALLTGAVVAAALWAAHVSDLTGLFSAGVAVGIVAWWGPGGRRVRGTVRAGLRRSVVPRRRGGVALVVLFLVAVALLASATLAGPQWYPADSTLWTASAAGSS